MSVRLLPDRPFHKFRAPRDQGIGELYVVQKRHTTDFDAPNCERIGRDIEQFSRIKQVLGTSDESKVHFS